MTNPKTMSRGHRSKNRVVHHIPIMPKGTDQLLATYSVKSNELNVEAVHLLKNQVYDETELHVMFTLNGKQEKMSTVLPRTADEGEVFKEMRDFIANSLIKDIIMKYVKTKTYNPPKF